VPDIDAQNSGRMDNFGLRTVWMTATKKSHRSYLAREHINSEGLADVRFGAHFGLKSDIA
jgi:hypothetical protein